jgi:hypothetical protein
MRRFAPKPQMVSYSKTGGQVFAVGAVIHLRTLDDAARVAAVLGLAAALLDVGGQGLAGDLLAPSNLPMRKFLVGSRPGLVDDVDEHGRAEPGRPWLVTG